MTMRPKHNAPVVHLRKFDQFGMTGGCLAGGSHPRLVKIIVSVLRRYTGRAMKVNKAEYEGC